MSTDEVGHYQKLIFSTCEPTQTIVPNFKPTTHETKKSKAFAQKSDVPEME
jgi:hypothetical protein